MALRAFNASVHYKDFSKLLGMLKIAFKTPRLRFYMERAILPMEGLIFAGHKIRNQASFQIWML